MGKRWNNPDFSAEVAGSGGTLEFWRSPVFGEKFSNVPAFLLPRLTELETGVPDTLTGRRIYYERVHCLLALASVLLALASVADHVDLASIRPDEVPAGSERYIGLALGAAFHQGLSLADIALATGLPPGQIVAIGKRTIRRTKWLSRIADSDLET
jgi:hypothetical protein